MVEVALSAPVTMGPSATSVGNWRAQVDGGRGPDYVSTAKAIDYYVEKPFLWMETGKVDRKVCGNLKLKNNI